MSTTACQHPPAAQYLDVDETRCRACATSLTFPRRPPTPGDAKDRQRDLLISGGEKRRVTEPLEVEDQEVTQHQVQEVLPERQDTDTQAIPSTPSLVCTCCKLTLPLKEFSTNLRALKRAQHSYQCRGCQAFRSRLGRELNPEETRRKGRERRQRYTANLTPEQQAAAKLRRRESLESTNSASRRYYARNARGRPVPKQRQGRPVLLLKVICRIRDNCPLASYCIDKEPTDQPQPLTRAGKGLG